MINVAIFIGTRPEAIKMAPVIHELRKKIGINCTVISTGQHREMLNLALADFNLKPDIDLDVMTPNQTLASLTSKLFAKIDPILEAQNIDWVLVQGDTTTVMVASLCAFYRKIRVGHIEAGLRSHNINEPFPEELNRRVACLVSGLHFAPTQMAAENLLKEGVSANSIFITGNTGIDSLLHISGKISDLPAGSINNKISGFLENYKKFILITGHRRENFGQGFRDICESISTLARENKNVGFLYAAHLNPNVRGPVNEILLGIDNVLVTEPQEYRNFVYLMSKSYFILSDSGGVQEEAPSLGKPVLVMRDVTERTESIIAGCSELVGSSKEKIISRVNALLRDSNLYSRMSKTKNPYGDGTASKKIVEAILKNNN